MATRSPSVLFLLALAAPLAAQQPPAPPGTDVLHDTFGVAMLDGQVHGLGPTYRAHFDGRGMEFLPALGSAAPADATLHVALDDVRRGEQTVFVHDATVLVPAVDENVVRYRHGRGLTEVYDVQRDGVEQSFVFAQRPAGYGDLVVSARVTTGLPLVAGDAHAGLRYEVPGLGGVTIGAVTGIDALGNRVAGTIRALGARGERIEYTLPGWFVDRAAYPLTLDPLFGASFQIDAAATGAPDVAFDATTQRYLVVWNVGLSGGNTDVRGRLVSATGTLVASPILVDTEGYPDRRPAVAGIHTTDRFLVGWVRLEPVIPGVSYSAQLKVRAVTAATGVQTPIVHIAGSITLTSAASVTDFDLGGDSRTPLLTTPDRALVAYRLTVTDSFFPTTHSLRCARIQVPSSGDPVLVGGASGVQVLSATDYPSQISVSSHAGSAGRWLVLACSSPDSTSPTTAVNGYVVQDSSSMLCGAGFQVATGLNLSDPAAATANGSAFAMAWHDATGGRIKIRPGTWSGTCGSGSMTLGAAIDPIQGSGTTTFPVLDFAQEKYVLAYRRKLLLFQPAVYAKTLDPVTCAVCGSEWLVHSSTSAQNTPAIVANFSGASNQQDGALVVWQSASEVRAVRYDATSSGSVANLGGSCGATGIVGYDGAPVLGSPGFALRLDAPSAPPLALIIGLSAVSIPCGPCVLVPNTDILMTGGGPHPLPLPCDLSYLGVQFWTQWLLFAPGGCPILPDFALSSAQRFTIGE